LHNLLSAEKTIVDEHGSPPTGDEAAIVTCFNAGMLLTSPLLLMKPDPDVMTTSAAHRCKKKKR
jgi:hypothetical protein